MQNKKAYELVTTGSPEITRHSPRNGLNGFLRALPGDRACLPPSSVFRRTDLTPASGRQDHTASPSASASFVKEASASIASRLTFMTIASVPLGEAGCIYVGLIWPIGEAKYFSLGGWTD
jgi:hypothetical protein